MIEIYHNPRCGKSRECLALVEASGKDYTIVPYLTDTPSLRDLKRLVKKLRIAPVDLVRKNEKAWLEFKDKVLSDDTIIELLVAHPILIQRPIVINGDKAVIARPVEKATSLL
jgi:arsenate reductase